MRRDTDDDYCFACGRFLAQPNPFKGDSQRCFSCGAFGKTGGVFGSVYDLEDTLRYLSLEGIEKVTVRDYTIDYMEWRKLLQYQKYRLRKGDIIWGRGIARPFSLVIEEDLPEPKVPLLYSVEVTELEKGTSSSQ